MIPVCHRLLLLGCAIGTTSLVQAQIDPYPRDLLQAGYHKELVGHAPISAFGLYYRNDPNFQGTNMALRTAISPVYFDGELGMKQLLGDYTDVGIGLNGGGFAYSYDEIRSGKWYHEESWTGHGGGLTTSLYHLFNPADRIPLYGIVRGGFQYAVYERDETTDPNFVVPENQPYFSLRGGLRYGGREWDLMPDMGMEISAWYEGQFRTQNGPYGYNGDREINSTTHLFWTRALLDYTMPEMGHRVGLALNGGTSIHPDRFSAYRIGGLLTLVSEFPYTLPGYYFGELSAKNMILVTGFYELPLDHDHTWRVGAGASTALVGYTPGVDQPGNWNSGVGGGVSYHTKDGRVKVVFSYGYGIDAIRSGGRGGHSVALAMQYDLAKSKVGAPGTIYGPERPSVFRRMLRWF